MVKVQNQGKSASYFHLSGAKSTGIVNLNSIEFIDWVCFSSAIEPNRTHGNNQTIELLISHLMIFLTGVEIKEAFEGSNFFSRYQYLFFS